MAAALDKDPYTYQKERDSFLKELWQFHQSRGTAFTRFPAIGGKEVDVYLLYSKVTVHGGWDKVNEADQWEDILEFFHIPRACTNAAQGLKHVYLRYLYVYEKVQFGDDPDQRAYDCEDETTGRKRTKTPVAAVPMRYNYRQHVIPESMRHAAGLCTDYAIVHDYVKLEKALLSGLPNEVDFAINVCTLLSNEGRHSMRIHNCPQMVHLLLAHVGLFKEGPGSLQGLSEDGWRPLCNRNFLGFWLDSVRDKEIRALISPSSLCLDNRGEKVQKDGEVEEAEPERPLEEDDQTMPLVDLLNLNRDLGVHDPEGQRILQMAMIIRNLSFEPENMVTLAADLVVFRFLQLCIHSKYGALRQLGLDTLGNLAVQTVLDPIDYRTTQLVLRSITRCISAQDKYEVIRGLEMLANLSQVDENVNLLSDNLEEKVYEDITGMLTVHDIQLIVYTLETLYQLSELGDVTSSHIADVKAAIDVLVGLTTVEAQSYGPNSLVGIKVVEHVPPPAPPATVQSHQVTPNRPSTPHPAARPAAVPTPPQPLQPGAQRPVNPAAPAPPRPPPPGPAQPEMDAETVACSWLQAYVEAIDHSIMTRVELYSEYLGTCGRTGVRNVINTNSFANCIRVTFPKVDSTRVEKEDGSAEIHYRGLRRRTTPLPFPSCTKRSHQGAPTGAPGTPPPASYQNRPAPSPASTLSSKASLIQQQLASPPQSRHAPPPSLPLQHAQQTAGGQAQLSPSYPTIHQALLHKGEGGPAQPSSPLSPQQLPGSPAPPGSPGLRLGTTPDTNLIKSLLANKVTANMHRIQQQQLQQQQQQNQQRVPQQQQPAVVAQMPVRARSPSVGQQLRGQPGAIGSAQLDVQEAQYVGQQHVQRPPLPVPVAQVQQPMEAYQQPQQLLPGASLTSQELPQTTPTTQHSLPTSPQPKLQPPSTQPQSEPDQGSHQPCLPVNRPPSRKRSLSPHNSPPRSASPRSRSPSRTRSPSPRSKLKATLVAKAAGNSSPPSQSANQQAGSLEVCSNAERARDVVRSDQLCHVAQIERVENRKTDNVTPTDSTDGVNKLDQMEASIEKVENTYVQKLEEEIEKQNEADLKDNFDEATFVCSSLPECHELRPEETPKLDSDKGPQGGDGALLEPTDGKLGNSHPGEANRTCAAVEKAGGLGQNGSLLKQQLLESQSDSKDNISANNAQMVNGNSVSKQLDALPHLDGKDHKSLYTDSDKLLTPEEIEQRKTEIYQLLEDQQSTKEQLLGLNGIVNHIGNGDCVLPQLHKAGERKSKEHKDMPGLSQDYNGSDWNLNLQHLKQQPAVLENGYDSPSPEEALDSKASVNIPCVTKGSAFGPVSNFMPPVGGAAVIKTETAASQPKEVDLVDEKPMQPVSDAKDLHLSTVRETQGQPVRRTVTPMEVDTAETKLLGNNGDMSIVTATTATLPTTSQCSAYETTLALGKVVGNKTIAEILKERQVAMSDSSSPGSHGAVVSVGSSAAPAVRIAVPPVITNSTSPALASNHAPRLPVVSLAAATASGLPSNVSRPTALPTNIPPNPQLMKVSETASVHSPTLSNLPTPGDLASQVKSAMQQQLSIPVSVSSQQPQQTTQQPALSTAQVLQSSALIQHLQQTTPSSQPQLLVQSAQQQTSTQQGVEGAQKYVPSHFAVQMQQLQQRLQMPPQCWQQKDQQTPPTQPQQQPPVAQPQILQQQLLRPVAPQQQTSLPVQPSIKSQLVQRLQQPLAATRAPAQLAPATQTSATVVIQSQPQPTAPILIQPQPQGQTQQQPFLIQQQAVNGQVHTQVVVTTQMMMPSQQAAQQAQTVRQLQAGPGHQIQIIQGQAQGQSVQFVQGQGQQVQLVQGQGQQVQLVPGQGQQVQIVQGQGQLGQGQGQVQVVQGQQVQMVQGQVSTAGQTVQVVQGQRVQMVQGQQVVQVQMPGQAMMQGQIVIQSQTGHRPIQPAPSQQPQTVGQMLLPKPPVSQQPQALQGQPQVLIVSQAQGTAASTAAQATVANQPPTSVFSFLQQPQQPLQIQLQQQLSSPMEVTAALSPGGTALKRPSTTLKIDSKPSKKSRSNSTDSQRSTSSTGQQSQSSMSHPSPAPTPPATSSGDYVCDWAGCKQCFETWKACTAHVVKTHYDDSLDLGFCRWEGCDKLKRQRWSLITHIQDRHLAEQAQKAAIQRRQQHAVAPTPPPTTATPTAPSAPPVYPADAAIQAIRRFAPRQPYPEFMQRQGAAAQQQQHHHHHHHHRSQHPIPPLEETKEGPVTKHIRLTSALILRNIAKYSVKGRKLLLKYEQQLSFIALSAVEASTAVAHCLWELQRDRTNKICDQQPEQDSASSEQAQQHQPQQPPQQQQQQQQH